MGYLLKWKQKQATRNYDDGFFFPSAEMSRSLIVGREKTELKSWAWILYLIYWMNWALDKTQLEQPHQVLASQVWSASQAFGSILLFAYKILSSQNHPSTSKHQSPIRLLISYSCRKFYNSCFGSLSPWKFENVKLGSIHFNSWGQRDCPPLVMLRVWSLPCGMLEKD